MKVLIIHGQTQLTFNIKITLFLNLENKAFLIEDIGDVLIFYTDIFKCSVLLYVFSFKDFNMLHFLKVKNILIGQQNSHIWE